ncbi:MAG: hypothetical protein ACI83H_002121 [Glaciecola sp.]|jgi:hypothetical protein
MNNELIKPKSWRKRNWKWLLPISVLTVIFTILFFSTGMNVVATHIAKAYADTDLYENALEKVKSDQRANELLGKIEHIDKLAILEGSVVYSDDNKTVNSSIRVKGEKLNAMMDITAILINNKWNYEKINIRVKNPPEKKQTIEIITAE